jgi:hypothetical protein
VNDLLTDAIAIFEFSVIGAPVESWPKPWTAITCSPLVIATETPG